MHVKHHSPLVNRLVLPSTETADCIESNKRQPELFQPHGNAGAVGVAMTQAGGGTHVKMCSQQQRQQQQESLPVASGTNCPPDMPDDVVPNFSRIFKPAADELSSEALTPVMIPHAQARIQAQHDTTATTPSVAVVKDTPQSAAAATPWSCVKDTPSNSEVTPLQRGSLPHGLWLGLGQTSSSRPPLSVPVQSSIHSASCAQQRLQVSDAVGGDHLYPGGRPQEQLDASPPAPELTLRLSLSDGSSTKSNKAGPPSPSRGGQPAQQHATPPMQPNLTATTYTKVHVELVPVPVGSKSAAQSDSLRVSLPRQRSLQASQATDGLPAGGQLQKQQLRGQQYPAPATNSCCQGQAATLDNPLSPTSVAATAAAAAAAAERAPNLATAAVASTLAGASQPNQTGFLQFNACGRMQQLPQERDPDQDRVMNDNIEHIVSHISEGQNPGKGGSSSEAGGHGDPPSADQQADHPRDGDHTLHPSESDHRSPYGTSSDPSVSTDSDPNGGAPDDPDPGSNDGPSATPELVPYRYKQRAPTQVSPACQASIICNQAASSTARIPQTQHGSAQGRSCCAVLLSHVKHSAVNKSQIHCHNQWSKA